jgi:hypothetical protein
MSPREVSGCRAALLKGFSRVFFFTGGILFRLAQFKRVGGSSFGKSKSKIWLKKSSGILLLNSFLSFHWFFLLVASYFDLLKLDFFGDRKFSMLEASSFKVEEIWWYPFFKCQNKNLGISFLRC